MIVKRYICTEYEGDMEVSRIRDTHSLEEAEHLLPSKFFGSVQVFQPDDFTIKY